MVESCFQVINNSPLDVLPMTLYTSHMYICINIQARSKELLLTVEEQKQSELNFYRLVDSVLAWLAGCRSNNDKPKKSGSNHSCDFGRTKSSFSIAKMVNIISLDDCFFNVFTSFDPSSNVTFKQMQSYHDIDPFPQLKWWLEMSS